MRLSRFANIFKHFPQFRLFSFQGLCSKGFCTSNGEKGSSDIPPKPKGIEQKNDGDKKKTEEGFNQVSQVQLVKLMFQKWEAKSDREKKEREEKQAREKKEREKKQREEKQAREKADREKEKKEIEEKQAREKADREKEKKQREEKQAREKKEREKEKKQREEKQTRNKNILLGIVFTLAGLLLTGYIDMSYYRRQKQQKKKLTNQDLSAFRQKFGSQKMTRKRQAYQIQHIPNKSLERQLEKYMRQPPRGKLQILYCLAGSGKTDAFAYLVEKLRQQGKKVFYISLRAENRDGSINIEQTKKSIHNLYYLISVLKRDSGQLEGAILVVDDINVLSNYYSYYQSIGKPIQQSYGSGQKGDLFAITTMPKSQFNIILMSSSDSFVDKYQSTPNFLSKESTFNIVQPLLRDERKQILNIYFKKKGLKKQEIPKNVLEKLSQQRTLRQSFEIAQKWIQQVNNIENPSQQQKQITLSKIYEYKSELAKNKTLQIINQFHLDSRPQFVKLFFELSLEKRRKQILQDIDCAKLRKQFQFNIYETNLIRDGKLIVHQKCIQGNQKIIK